MTQTILGAWSTVEASWFGLSGAGFINLEDLVGDVVHEARCRPLPADRVSDLNCDVGVVERVVQAKCWGKK